MFWMLLPLALPAQPQGPPPGMDCPRQLVVITKSGPNGDKLQDFAPAHIENLRKLMDQGTLVAAGPFVGEEAGMFLFKSADWAEVEPIL
jgi:hypothetical protein